ncbi:MAG: hypothetical protein GY854_12870 [Deltaproteobacteria bacterium]|nr:hypothetical protein [Deltaproteobacteria bacterium]
MRILSVLLVALVCACNGENNESIPDGGQDTEQESPCPWDDDDEHANATALTMSSPAEGFLCPIGDQDWYAITVPSGTDLLSVELTVDAPVAPIDPTYSIWTADAASVVASPTASEAAGSSKPIQIVHGLEAGEYLLVVRDRADDSEDVRHPYRISIAGSVDTDTNEPNNTDDTATATGGTAMQGYISYRGDEDWFQVESEAQGLLRLRLTMPMGGIEPAYRIVSPEGDDIISDANEAGKHGDTDLEYLQALETEGTYYVVISDDDNLDDDNSIPYSLELILEEDPDANEANDHPSEATELGVFTCAAEWSDWTSVQAFLGSSGDIDWYKIELETCGRGLLEVEVSFDEPTTLPEDLQATARLVLEREQDVCVVDQDCQKLARTCELDLDCSRVGNTCLDEGVCAGAGVCLPGDICGVSFLSVAAPETVGDPPNQTTNPNRGTVLFAAPVNSNLPVYLAVEDYHSDAYSIDHGYTLRTRVRTDPDTHEISEAYTAGPPTIDDEPGTHIIHAKEVTVHDCIGGVSCCGSDTWEEGFISYSYDQDWYSYTHPCPGQDCMLRVVYEFGEGPVDFYMHVYEGETLWYDTLVDTFEEASHAATSDVFGGLGADDECFYGFSEHQGEDNPFFYYLMVRDTIYVSEGQAEDGTWDFSSEQAYRFCIEKIADGCLEPCVQYPETGCGPVYEE